MKVAVGLSGGVDSAVSAALLTERGYQVTGVFLECWREPGCRTDADRKDALTTCLKLKIPFRVLVFRRQYREKVIAWCYREYRAGRTPNPDILCNREIKFGLFLNWAMKHGFDYVAIGHYCRLTRQDKFFAPRHRVRLVSKNLPLPASIHLLRSADKDKDQTYFLAMLKAKQLRRVLFPVGHLTKNQVRLEAKKRGLSVWNKKDSTGICFIGEGRGFRSFLKQKISEHEGEAVDKHGRVVGRHRGAEFYTIGQRWHRPNFVIHKDIKNNRLIVGKKRDLAKKEFKVERWSGINSLQIRNLKCLLCRIRHQGRLIPCRIEGRQVRLGRPEYGVAPGQAAVIYRGRECLGGGVIR